MKRAVTFLMWVLVLGGCTTAMDGEPTAESQDGLICDPYCDPTDTSYEPALYGAYDYGFKLFADAVPTDQSCADWSDAGLGWECFVSFTTATNPCGPVVVSCTDAPTHGRSRVKCNARAIDNCR